MQYLHLLVILIVIHNSVPIYIWKVKYHVLYYTLYLYLSHTLCFSWDTKRLENPEVARFKVWRDRKA